jgi:hypothetical protein
MTPSADPLPLFARLALEEGHLEAETVRPLLRESLDTTQDDGSVAFANLCLKQGLLTPVQVQNLLLLQSYRVMRREDEALGTVAVREGAVKEAVVRSALDRQSREFVAERRLPRRLSSILLEAGVVTPAVLAQLLPGIESLLEAPARPAGAAAACGWLVVEYGKEPGRCIPIGESTVVGRFPSGDIPIHDPRVSHRHIRIETDPATGAAVLVDLGSRNGTILNVKRVRGQAPLEPGDLIRIGKTVLRYVPAGTGPVTRALVRPAPPPPAAKPPAPAPPRRPRPPTPPPSRTPPSSRPR